MVNQNVKIGIALMALMLSTASLGAHANGAMGEINQPPYATAFRLLDKDGNGMLDKSEADREELFAKNFADADANHDGVLSKKEYGDYKSSVEQKTVKRIARDSLITTKIKAALVKEEGVDGLRVSVETHEGVVLLSGFVNSAEQIAGAGKIASTVDGVRAVKNGLQLSKDRG